METRPLGTSGLAVSRLALGSWRTFERRDEVVVANKLWWESWPAESAAAELDASLGRMGFEVLDLAYAAPLPAGLGVERCVAEMGGLIASGRLRAWGTLNWRPGDLAAGVAAARDQGVPLPCAAQLPYSLVHRTTVESDAMAAALDAGGVAVVASAVLAGGALTGKYAAGDGRGRLAGRTGDEALGPALAAGADIVALSREVGASPAALAVAFALANPRVASVLFGATAPDQVDDDVAALDVLAGLDPRARAALAALGAPG